jgi:toxin HigB-1
MPGARGSNAPAIRSRPRTAPARPSGVYSVSALPRLTRPEHPVNQRPLLTREMENSYTENAGSDRNPDGCARLPASQTPNRRMDELAESLGNGGISWRSAHRERSTRGYSELTWLEFGSSGRTRTYNPSVNRQGYLASLLHENTLVTELTKVDWWDFWWDYFRHRAADGTLVGLTAGCGSGCAGDCTFDVSRKIPVRWVVIRSFQCKKTERLFRRERVKEFASIASVALRRLVALDGAQALSDLLIPPSNRLEPLSGDRKGQHSIRINDQYRICFTWRDGNAEDVEITKHYR